MSRSAVTTCANGATTIVATRSTIPWVRFWLLGGNITRLVIGASSDSTECAGSDETRRSALQSHARRFRERYMTSACMTVTPDSAEASDWLRVAGNWVRGGL